MKRDDLIDELLTGEPTEETESCGSCSFFGGGYANPKRGACHRYPPTILTESDGASSVGNYWPCVSSYEFCGEYRRAR